MQQTANQGYYLAEIEDNIRLETLAGFNGNFNKLDASVTSIENGVEAFSDNYEPNTVEGTDLYITDSASAPIKDISIGENSEITQDGEPTPEDEAKVNVVEGNITLVDQSKNIVDWGNTTSTSRATIEWKDDTLKVSGEGANTLINYSILQFIKANPGNKLHFGYESLDVSQFNSTSNVIVQLHIVNDEATSYITMLTKSGMATDYTIPSDTSKITMARLRVITNNTSTETTSKLVITKPQLELGEVSTSYAKYGKQSYPITLPNGMFLGKIGNASNYIYGDIDNWKLHKGIDVLEDMSILTSNGLDESKIGLLTPTLNIDAGLSSPNLASIVKCNSLPSVPNNNSGLSGTTDSSKIRIYLSTEYASTYEEAKTFLANKNTKIYYARSTSEDILITDETLISQLNNIKRNMTTYKDGTIIFTLTDGLNPSVKLTYGLNLEIETNEKIAEVQAELDLLKSNFDVKTSPNSDNMNITDAINSYIPVDNEGNKREIKIGDGTEITQKTTDGYNILPIVLESKVVNGLTVTVNSDKSITLNGTTTSAVTLTVFEGELSLNGTFNFYLYGKSGKINLQGTENNSAVAYLTFAATSEHIKRTYDAETNLTKIFSYIGSGTTFNNETLKYMVTKGDDIYEYEQYTNGASPNPDYPQKVNVVEGDCGIEESNKNLFEVRNPDYTKQNARDAYGGDGSYVIKGQTINMTTGYGAIAWQYDDLVVGETYTFSTKVRNYGSASNISIGLNEYSAHTESNTGHTTYTVANSEVIFFKTFTADEKNRLFIGTGTTGGVNVTFYDIQLEKGSIQTSYVPHKGKSFDITLPEGMFLGSIGTASNYIYGTKDNWKLISGLGKTIVPSTIVINTVQALSTPTPRTVFLCNGIFSPKTLGGNFMSNCFKYQSTTSNKIVIGSNGVQAYFSFDNNILNISPDETDESKKQKLVNWLSNNELIIYYKLATVTETDITDTTLISQLNNIIDNLQTYKDGTVVFTSGESLAPNIQFDYLQNPLASIEARLDLLEE